MPSSFALTAQTLVVKLNQASGGATPPAPLDWSKVQGATLAGQIANLSGKLLLVAGTLTLDVADFVHVSGSFALEKGDDIFITRAGETTTRKVTLLRFGISGGTLFAGINATNPGERVGLSLTNVSLGLALMKDAPGVGTTSYTALIASGTASLVGVDGLDISGTLRVELNQNSTPPTRMPSSTSRSSRAASSTSRPVRTRPRR